MTKAAAVDYAANSVCPLKFPAFVSDVEPVQLSSLPVWNWECIANARVLWLRIHCALFGNIPPIPRVDCKIKTLICWENSNYKRETHHICSSLSAFIISEAKSFLQPWTLLSLYIVSNTYFVFMTELSKSTHNFKYSRATSSTGNNPENKQSKNMEWITSFQKWRLCYLPYGKC